VFEERAAPGIDEFEVRRIGEKFIAGGDVNPVVVECDASQTTIRAAALPIDICRVPVDNLLYRLFFNVYQVDTAVTLALLTATDDRTCDQSDY
jgi:hypothetical protein